MKINKFQVTLFIGWLTFTAIAFTLFTLKRIVPFDPNGALEKVSKTELINKIFESNKSIDKANTIVNFYQADCACNEVSKNHIKQLENLAVSNSYNFINVQLEKDQFIPSTPSIAIIDNQSNLVYFGPYGEGIGCSQTNGFAKTVFKNHLKGYSSNLIISSAQGCYCNT